MILIPNQPISQLTTLDNAYNRPEGEDATYPTFLISDYIYVQWKLEDCGDTPSDPTDIQLYNDDDTLAYNLGTWSEQTTNKTWFTLKFKLTDLSLPEGCYYITWKECDGLGGFTDRQSNVFSVKSTLYATKLVVASCDCYGFGFDWSAFVLSWRVPFAKFNPEYEIVTEDYLNADQTNIKHYAERGKFWSIRTGVMSEPEHDCLSLQILCDELLIDGVEYYFKDKNYDLTDWDRDGQTLTSCAEFKLHKQNDQVVNNNCQDCNDENYPYYGS